MIDKMPALADSFIIYLREYTVKFCLHCLVYRHGLFQSVLSIERNFSYSELDRTTE